MAPQLLTVVVATYKHPEMLMWCLRTLTHYSPWDYKIVVVDGSETNEDQQAVHRITRNIQWEELDLIQLGENRKAMGAFNAALAACETPYIAFLHDDAYFIPGSHSFWPSLMDVAVCDDVGMCGPALSNCVGLQHYLRWDLPDLVDAWYLYGACMMFQTERIRALGGMDENISPSDDIELAVRVKNAGFDIVVNRRCFLMYDRHQTYEQTRTGDEGKHLEESFNKIVAKHGVAATCEMFFHESEWEMAKIASPTIWDFQRLTNGGAPEWQQPEGVWS